nr:immunoglobulin light chain junction region [Macaca mulatta]
TYYCALSMGSGISVF